MNHIRRVGAKVRSSKNAALQEVPNEILGHIFEEYIKLGQSPWFLTLVSRLWRTVSLANPNLWRYIHIAMVTKSQKASYVKWKISDGSLSAISYGNRQVCRSAWELSYTIRRTGSTGLDVTIGPPGGVDDLVEILLTKPISSRIARLEFIDDLYFNATLIKNVIGPFTALEQLLIPSRTSTGRLLPLIYSIQRTAFKFREFHLESPLLGELVKENPQLSPESIKALFGRLYALKMMGKAAREIDACVQYCSHLVELTCDFLDWPKESTEVEVLKNIQTLSLNCAPKNLYHLDLSSLRELTLDDSTDPESFFSGSNQQIDSNHLDLPSLVKLRIASRTLDWLMDLQAPRLREFHIQIRQECICSNARWERRLSYATCIHKLSRWSGLSLLSTLSLTASCTEENFMVVLGALTGIQSLTIIRRRSKNEPDDDYGVLDRLAERFVAGGLPQLDVFILGDEVWPVYKRKETLDRQVGHLLQLQGQRDREMVCFDVYWSNGRTFSAKEKLSYVK